jgi:hypothetical protein
VSWVRRRYDELPSSFWILFDLVFGILTPLVCLYLDPLFGSDSDGPRLNPFQLWVYAFAAFQSLALLVRLVFRKPSAFIASTLGLGACFASLVACIVVPFSLFLGGTFAFLLVMSFGDMGQYGSHPFDAVFGGMMLTAGLGLSTGCTALVYTRSCIVAMRQAARHWTEAWPVIALTTGPLLAIAVPSVAVQVARAQASNAVQEFLLASEAEEPVALYRLSSLRAFANANVVRDQYWHETDPDRKAKLNRAYVAIAHRRLDD